MFPGHVPGLEQPPPHPLEGRLFTERAHGLFFVWVTGAHVLADSIIVRLYQPILLLQVHQGPAPLSVLGQQTPTLPACGPSTTITLLPSTLGTRVSSMSSLRPSKILPSSVRHTQVSGLGTSSIVILVLYTGLPCATCPQTSCAGPSAASADSWTLLSHSWVQRHPVGPESVAVSSLNSPARSGGPDPGGPSMTKRFHSAALGKFCSPGRDPRSSCQTPAWRQAAGSTH